MRGQSVSCIVKEHWSSQLLNQQFTVYIRNRKNVITTLRIAAYEILRK